MWSVFKDSYAELHAKLQEANIQLAAAQAGAAAAASTGGVPTTAAVSVVSPAGQAFTMQSQPSTRHIDALGNTHTLYQSPMGQSSRAVFKPMNTGLGSTRFARQQSVQEM
jgi:hypothetical protein